MLIAPTTVSLALYRRTMRGVMRILYVNDLLELKCRTHCASWRTHNIISVRPNLNRLRGTSVTIVKHALFDLAANPIQHTRHLHPSACAAAIAMMLVDWRERTHCYSGQIKLGTGTQLIRSLKQYPGQRDEERVTCWYR